MWQCPAIGPTLDPGIKTGIEIADFHAVYTCQQRYPTLVVRHWVVFIFRFAHDSQLHFVASLNWPQTQGDGVLADCIASQQSRPRRADPCHFITRAAAEFVRLAYQCSLPGRQGL